MNFKDWLAENQMRLFSTSSVELYHGSNTGLNDSVLNNFKARGVLPTGKGHGQGEGFLFSATKSQQLIMQ